MYVPFSLSLAFYFLLLGLVARYLIENYSIKRLFPIAFAIVLIVTAVMWFQRNLHWRSIIRFQSFYWLIMPIAIFLLLYRIRSFLSKSKIFVFLGNHSLQIYLIHVFIINILEVLLLLLFPRSIGVGIVIYILTIAFSSWLAIFLRRMPFFSKLVFAKG